MPLRIGSDAISKIYVGADAVAKVYVGADLVADFGGGAAYEATPVNFDGTNDYLTRGADLTGAADSKLWTGSLWIRRNGGTGATRRIIMSTSNRFMLAFNSSNQLQVVGFTSAPAEILRLTIATITDSNWRHVAWSVDMADTAKRHVYLNDTASMTVVTYTLDGVIDFTPGNASIGATVSGGERFLGDLADVQQWFGTYVDLSVEANRRLFVTATGEPVDPATAEASLGEPIVQLTGATADWHTNKGSGGGFTENGAITDGAVTPVEF